MTWQEEFRRKLVTAEEAIQCVQSGMRVYIHPGCAEPEVLVEALMARGPAVRNVEIVHLLTLGRADYIAREMEGHFRHNAMFIGGNVRQAVNEGRADYTPIFLSQVEELFESGQMPLDIALIQVSPPDTAWILQLRCERGCHAERGASGKAGDCAIECADAANVWRLLRACAGYRCVCRSVTTPMRIEAGDDHRHSSRDWEECCGLD